MADPLGIIGVIGVATQIIQIVVQFGLDWKDAPADARIFKNELQALKTALCETNVNMVLSQDFRDAFHGRHSVLLSQLGPAAQPTDTQVMLSACREELNALLKDLEKRARGHRVGWERLKGAFVAKKTRETVENLQRQCQTLNSMMAMDTLSLGVSIHKEVKEARKEQQDWHHAEAKVNSEIKDGVDELHDRQDRTEIAKERKAILNWLAPTDYALQQSDYVNRRQAGTGQWLLDSVQFKSWLETREQTLFCPGIPGAGKTILTSVVVNDLTARFGDDETTGVAYLYFNYRQQDNQKFEHLFSSLLRQLAQGRPSLPESVKSLHDKCQDERRPSCDEIMRALQSVTATYSRVFIIVDALDECQDVESRAEFLAAIFDLQVKSGLNLFATSRLIPDIEKSFEGRLTLPIRADRGDVWKYLDKHMSNLPDFVTDNLSLRDEIKTTIEGAIDGMFLLAQLYLDSLVGKRSIKAIRKALEGLQDASNTYLKRSALDCAYDKAMDRIQRQSGDLPRDAMLIISWIVFAERPLTVLELQHALAVEVGTNSLDQDNIPTVRHMLQACAPLVTVDEEGGIIRLVHYTTQEYFERTQEDWFQNAEAEITTTCVTYLSFSVFGTGICKTDEEFEKRLRSNPLYDYAAHNWGNHACRASTSYQRVMQFLWCPAEVEAASQVLMATKRYSSHSGYSQEVPRYFTELHLAAYFGITEAVTTLLRKILFVNMRDSYNQTPQSYAAARGHEAVVELLLKNGANPESKDRYGKTPLWWAAEKGHGGVVKLLLKNGADIESKDTANCRTPLSLAAGGGHGTLVKLLLENGADIESKDHYGETPLARAAGEGHEAVVKLLLENGANIKSKDNGSLTPILFAAQLGYDAIVKLLLEKGDDIESKDRDGRTLLSWAADCGEEAVVKLLLENGADTESKDNTYRRTPLLFAIRRGQEAVIKLLVESGADIESKDMFGQAPILWAAESGYEATVKLFVAHGADIESQDPYRGKTALYYAAELGREAIVQLLLENGANTGLRDKDGQTPLLEAAQRGHGAIVKLLLEKGADIESKDKDGLTPLLGAAQYGYGAVVKLLLEKGADIESKDKDGRTPLSWAAGEGHEAVVKLLLENGAATGSSDPNLGRTPLSWAAEGGHEAVVKLLAAL